MDEVVVIGYGAASKRDLTGSITKISGKEIADKPNVNPIASLQGRVAGLYIVNNGTPVLLLIFAYVVHPVLDKYVLYLSLMESSMIILTF